MGYEILIRRGLKANLPASAPAGELFETTDTHELFIGTDTGLLPVVNESANATAINGVQVLNQAPDDGEILIFDGASGKYVPGDPIVSGPDAVGVAPTRNPVQAGVLDSTGKISAIEKNADDGIPVHVQNPTSGPVAVSNFPVTQPVSAAALPLPTGAATEASLGTDGTSPPTIPGTGIRGWLRSIYDTLKATLAVNNSQWGGTAVTAPPDSTGAIPVTGGGPFASLGVFNNASGTPTVSILAGSNHYSTLTMHITYAGTVSGGQFQIEGSIDNTNWIPIPSHSIFAGSATYPYVYQNSSGIGMSNGRTCAYFFTVAGFPYLRFHITAAIPSAGTPTATVYYSLLNEPSCIPIDFPSIIASGTNAETEPMSVLSPNNTQVGSGALSVGLCVHTTAPGTNSAVGMRTPAIFKTLAAVAVTAGTPVAAWTPSSGKKFRIMGYALSLSVAGAVIMKDSAAEMIRTPLMPAGIGQASPRMGNGILSALANNVLNIDVTASGTVSGFVFGTEE